MKTLLGILVASIWMSGAAVAAPVVMLLETNDDELAGSEVFSAKANSVDDVVNSSFTSLGFTSVNIAPTFSIAGLAFDGAYQLVVERNDDAEAGDEVLLATFNTQGDIDTSTIASVASTQINIAPDFSIHGVAYDGAYHLLVESNEDRAVGDEVLLATYDTLDDLKNGVLSSVGFTQLNIAPDFSIAGFVYDGLYRLLVERNEDVVGGSEVVEAVFSTLDDLVASSILSTSSSDLNIAPLLSIAGIASEFKGPDAEIPLPPAALLFLAGVSGLAGLRRKKAPR